MNEALLTGLLLRKALGAHKRMIYGTTRQANKTIGCRFNNTYTYNTNDGKWEYTGGTLITATSDSDKYFEIEIPENMVITNFTFDTSFGAHQDNPDQIITLNLSNIGKVNQLEMLLYAFSNLTQVTAIAGFNKFAQSPLLTMEGCFRACEKLVSLDFTGLNTDDMVAGSSGGSARYGFPNCFYNCISLEHLVLPKIPSTCYMGGGTFFGCEKLSSVECSGEVANDLWLVTQSSSTGITGGAPLTRDSMRNILSYLSTTHPATCEFWDAAWYWVTKDSHCQALVASAERNGWSFVPTYSVYWFDDCKTYDHFHTSSGGCYLVGTEKTTDTNPCPYMVGKTYMICNESSSVTTHDHGEYRFDSGMDLTNATQLDIVIKDFMWTQDPGTGSSNRIGLTRMGIDTRDSSQTQVTTVNDNFPFYIRWVDSNGNTGSWTLLETIHTIQYNQSDTTTTQITHTISLPSVDFNSGSVIGFDIMYMKTDDSVKERIKGCWYNSILIK